MDVDGDTSFSSCSFGLVHCYFKDTTTHVTREKGENAILSCGFEAREITHIVLSSLSKNILVCENEECESENGRVSKEGSCDVIIKDLRPSDAGKYILRVYYTDDQTELKRQIINYQLHIHDEISVKTGEELKMDVLLTNADKVEKNSSGEWTEVWTRGHGVTSDRLTDRDGNLIIKAFTSTDSGTYRVLDSDGEIWITVTVTESGSTGEHEDSLHRYRELLSDYYYWPEIVSGIFVITLVIVYIVIMAIQIVLRIAGLW